MRQQNQRCHRLIVFHSIYASTLLSVRLPTLVLFKGHARTNPLRAAL